MIGKGIARWVDAMRRIIDRRAIDGCKSSLDWPSTCPGVVYDLVGVGQLPVRLMYQRYKKPCARQVDLRRRDGRCRSKCCASSSRGLIAEVRCRADVVVDLVHARHIW